MNRPFIPYVAGVDIPWFDHNLVVEQFPETNQSTRVLESGYCGGGKVATALAAAGTLGVPSALIGVLGTGSRDRFLREDFAYNRVDLGYVREIEAYRCGQSAVISALRGQERRIFWESPSHADALSPETIAPYLPDLEKINILHLCRMDDVGRFLAEKLRKKGVQICFDGDFYDPALIDHLDLVDILIASESFHRDVFQKDPDEDTLSCLAAKGPATVVITLGSRGGVFLDDGRFERYDAFSERLEIVDTVGAGDVFHGAYIAALFYGFDVPAACRYASAAAAIKCTARGGRAGIPDHETLMAYLKTGRLDETIRRERELFYRQLEATYLS